jgi:hypothetical protein
MAKPAEVQVTGMKEVRKALKEFSSDNGWRAPLRDADRDVARLVETKAVGKAGSSRMGHVARGSIKGKGTTTGASIEAYKGVPWGPGFEFGSGGRYPQFPPKKVGGYHLYPSIDESRGEITETFAESVDSALNKEF